MTTMTLAQLQLAVRQRADIVNSQFVSDDELTSYINQSYFELYDLIVSRYGDNYYVQTPYQFTTNGTDAQFPLPTDFYKLLGVDLSLTNQSNTFVTLKPFEFAERNNGAWISSNQIPTAGQLIQLWYVPQWTPLVLTTDTAVNVAGWLEYIIIDAAIKCMQKEESDVTVLGLQKGAIIARIEAMAANRDAGMPARVSDVQSYRYQQRMNYRINGNNLWLRQNACWDYGFGYGDGYGSF